MLHVMNFRSIGSLLHQCSKTKSYLYGISLHAMAIKAGLFPDIIVSNHVLNMYAKCGDIPQARQLFDEMPHRNLVSWSALISGCQQFGQYPMSLELFSRMNSYDLEPNEYIYASVISSCATLKALLPGKQIHARVVKLGYAFVSFVGNSLITMYMKTGCSDDSLSVFGCMSERNVVSYNALIAGLVENNENQKALEVFKLMQQQVLVADKFSFVVLSGMCPEFHNLHCGMAFHCLAVKLKLDTSAFVGNLLIAMYASFNCLDSVDKSFVDIREKDVISWNTFIAACTQCADYKKALSIFLEMVAKLDLIPDEFTFSSAIVACAGLASIRHGKQIHAHLIRTKSWRDVGVGNALINMYAKCGCIEYACNTFSGMHYQNLVSWNTMVAALGNHGLVKRAIETFEQMKAVGVKPDSVTFVGLLVACNHAGLVDKGLTYFNIMEEEYGISANLEHFSCLIDMLGRAGRLSEAEEYIRKHHFENDPIILGSLLSACRLHKNVFIGEQLAKRLVTLHPVSTSPYVLLSNLYASDEAWDGVAKARKLLKDSRLKKEPGYSLVEVDGIFEKFTIKDFSYSRMDEIEYILKNINLTTTETHTYGASDLS